MKCEYKHGDKVEFVGFPGYEGKVATVVGLAVGHVIHIYIVALNEFVEVKDFGEADTITVPAGCLKPVE